MIDIRYGTGSEWDILSNLAIKPFTFDGIYCRTIEGVLQSIKTDNFAAQRMFFEADGFACKRAGKLLDWKQYRILYWNGVAMDRDGEDYQSFLDRLYIECWKQSPMFRQVLLDSKPEQLCHTVGHNDDMNTILTRTEFISRLEFLRDLPVKKKAP